MDTLQPTHIQILGGYNFQIYDDSNNIDILIPSWLQKQIWFKKFIDVKKSETSDAKSSLSTKNISRGLVIEPDCNLMDFGKVMCDQLVRTKLKIRNDSDNDIFVKV